MILMRTDGMNAQVEYISLLHGKWLYNMDYKSALNTY
jgi:hypothetical protein